MSNGLNVFGMQEHFATDEQVDRMTKVLEEKLDPKLIKQRVQGKTTLSYIGGHTVIRLLNKAFGYKWSFEIVNDEIVPSQPKINKYAKEGESKFEDQAPVVKVLGRLTVPGVGVKEQYGSKVLIGGASEQEAAFKSASTDALKKCATMFGIGLELYEDDDEAAPAPAAEVKPAYNKSNYSSGKSSYKPQDKSATTSAPAPAPKPNYGAPQTPADQQYEGVDIAKIKELKAVLGVVNNSELDPYAREFLDLSTATFTSITPTNIKAFNVFLSKKAANV